MKSIKPGRGPSAMGGVASIIAVIFGIFWTITAASMGAPGFFPLFGVLFVILGIVQAVYNFKNATGENRYSSFDIVEDGEEPDPLNVRFGDVQRNGPAPEIEKPYWDPPQDAPAPEAGDFCFCPYCGARLGAEFTYCGKCGRKLPDIQ